MTTGPKPAGAALLAMLSSALSAAMPAAAQSPGHLAPASARCEVLRADEGWRHSAVTVRPDQFVCVAAGGLWSHGVQGLQAITPYYGPEGFAKDDPASVPEVVARTGVLIGKVGENQPFVIGRQLCFVPSATGRLALSMNDLPGAFGNNAGAVHVAISTWPATTPPARIGAHPPACRHR